VVKRDVKVREQRFFDTETSQELWQQRQDMGWPNHLNPFSVLIAAMGNHWREDCRESVQEMAQATFNQGYDVVFYEEHDRCYQPYDALGIMRNLAYHRAIKEGFEFICYVDNDVRPSPDTLIRLMHRFVPVISPIIVYSDGKSHGLSMPTMEQNRGLAMVTSFVLSLVVFQTSVFLPFATSPFWQDALGADENYHFSKLAMMGHRPFVDTDVVVECVTPPSYPLDRTVDRSVASLDSYRSELLR
jgi:hypothetical protein